MLVTKLTRSYIGISMKRLDRHSSRLLDDTEWNLLNSGLPNYYSHVVNLYDRQKAYSFVMEFARLALQFTDSHSQEGSALKSELLSRLFTASATISHFDVAHTSLLAMKDQALQRSCLKKLVEKMCETGQSKELVALPFSGLQESVDDILLEKCRSTKDVMRGTPYHQILYSWRVCHNDYRGGAAILLDRLQKLRQTGDGDRQPAGGDDALDTQITRQYLLLINTLSCVDSSQAFIMEDMPRAKSTDGGDANLALIKGLVDKNSSGDADPKLKLLSKAMSHNHGKVDAERKVITLGDLRKQYQDELDRIVAIQNDQYAYAPAEEDEMDVA
jgi:nuclear pore complex protein Nup160